MLNHSNVLIQNREEEQPVRECQANLQTCYKISPSMSQTHKSLLLVGLSVHLPSLPSYSHPAKTSAWHVERRSHGRLFVVLGIQNFLSTHGADA
jgi:hypothetical protein